MKNESGRLRPLKREFKTGGAPKNKQRKQEWEEGDGGRRDSTKWSVKSNLEG